MCMLGELPASIHISGARSSGNALLDMRQVCGDYTIVAPVVP